MNLFGEKSAFIWSHCFRLFLGGKVLGSKLPDKLISSFKQCNLFISNLIFIKEKQLLISSCPVENKIDIYKKEEEDCFKLKETLQHKGVRVLVETNNGMFISGGYDKNIKIWQSSSSFT